jgi:hypothetical protein
LSFREIEMPRFISRIARSAALAGVAGVLAMSTPGGQSLFSFSSALAQEATMSAQFRTALEPYGTWRHDRRFGDVWVPADVSSEWRPYTAGHWVYTDDYGWYWVANDQEAGWGWITYHYGRWYRDADVGWVWIPSNVWGPAWVDWRYGDQYVGWAPAAPDQYAADAEDDPAFWSFVSAGDLIAPSMVGVLLPFGRRAEFFERTRLVNRPVMTGGPDRHFAVNPGIAPATIAAIRGRAFPTYRVQPHVLVGTAAVPGAIPVRAAELRGERGTRGRTDVATRDIVQPTSTVVRPTRSAQQPQALARGEAGRLGDNPPRATRGATLQQGAVRPPGTPSGQPRGEQRTTGAAARHATPNAPPRTTAYAPAAPRAGAIEHRAEHEGSQRPAVVQRPPTERTPLAHAPAANQGVVHRAPVATARPQVSRPPAVAERPPHVAAPPRAAAAPPPHVSAPPRAAAAPRPAPPAAAARPAAPATTGAAPHGAPGQRRP